MAQLAAIELNRPSPAKTSLKQGKSSAPDFARELDTRTSAQRAEKKSVNKSANPKSADEARPAKPSDHTTPSHRAEKTDRSNPAADKRADNTPSAQDEMQTRDADEGDSKLINHDNVSLQDPQSQTDCDADAERDLSAQKDDDATKHEDRNAPQSALENIVKMDAPPAQTAPAQFTQSSNDAETTQPTVELSALEASGAKKPAEKKARPDHAATNGINAAQSQASNERPISEQKEKEKSAQPAFPTTVADDQKTHEPNRTALTETKSGGADIKAFEKKSDSSLPFAWPIEHSPNAPSSAGTFQVVPQQTALDAAPTRPVPYSSLPIEIGLRTLDGTKEISVDLSPKELGQLNVTINVSDQSSIQISFQTENPHTLALLQHDASHIRHALEQAGYSTTDNSLQFSLRQDNSSNSNSGQGEPKKSFSRKSGVTAISGGELVQASSLPRRLHLSQLDLSI